MPGTLWSAPANNPNITSLTTSTFSTAPVLTDLSPSQALIPASSLNLGTRIRLYAAGSYTATTTASSVAWGFYLSQPATGLVAASSAALAVSASTAVVVATAWPFQLPTPGWSTRCPCSRTPPPGRSPGRAGRCCPSR